MFATTSRSRQRKSQRQSEGMPPPPGTDSCYGVRSLDSSVAWSPRRDGQVEDGVDAEGEARQGVDMRGGEQGEQEVSEQGPEEQEGSDGRRRVTSPIDSPLPSAPFSPNSSQPDVPRLEPDAEIIPPSPDDTLHPLHHLDEQREEPISPPTRLEQRSLSFAHVDPDPPSHSEPSSPASYTSLPSYVASLSSLSRTSSPLSGMGNPLEYRPSFDEFGQDLVLPTLSLPSSSLHMSLKRWDGQVKGLKILILGDDREVLRELGGRIELGGLAAGLGVGLVRDDTVVMTLMTGLTSEEAERHVKGNYSALARLLNPRPPSGTEEDVKRLIRDYSNRSPWVHMVVDTTQDPSIAKLAKLVPTISEISGVPDLFQLRGGPLHESEGRSRVPTPPPRLSDGTPMPPSSLTVSCPTPRPSAPERSPSDTTGLIIRLLDHVSLVEEASIVAFLEYRRSQPTLPSTLSSSGEASVHSRGHSPSPASSSFDAPLPMPTVSRTRSIRDWEAGLSRRIAGQKDRERDLTRPTRRIKKRGERCGPLFPSPSHGGGISRHPFREMLRDWSKGASGHGASGRGWGKNRWGWGLVAAVVMVVGIGWWTGRS